MNHPNFPLLLKDEWLSVSEAGVVDYLTPSKYKTHIIKLYKSTTPSLLRRDTPPSKGGESYVFDL
jgi:hypothetical protein